MTRLLDKLNLRPQERRLVIFVAVVVFVALNWFFVRPYFGELGRVQQRMSDTEKSRKRFSDEIERRPTYERQYEALRRQGAQVANEDQPTSLTRDVNNQAIAAGVNVGTLTLVPRGRDVRTNSFFDEQSANLSFNNTGEAELVNFLYSLASQNSLIRVKSMTLRTDTGRMKLAGIITLVESFQKKQPTKAAVAAPVKTTSPAPKVATPPKKTNAPAKTASPAKTTNTPPKTVSPLGGPVGKTNQPKKAVSPGAGPK